jgi:hypothetical protein
MGELSRSWKQVVRLPCVFANIGSGPDGVKQTSPAAKANYAPTNTLPDERRSVM